MMFNDTTGHGMLVRFKLLYSWIVLGRVFNVLNTQIYHLRNECNIKSQFHCKRGSSSEH